MNGKSKRGQARRGAQIRRRRKQSAKMRKNREDVLRAAGMTALPGEVQPQQRQPRGHN